MPGGGRASSDLACTTAPSCSTPSMASPRGVPKYADVAVRAFTASEYDQFLERNPAIDFMRYIGDTGVSGPDRDVALGVAVHAG
eukprot:9032273-Pyramimonas_sp.AAC.1